MSITFRVTGFDQMRRTLERINSQLSRAINQALENEANRVLESSQSEVPVVSGDLRDSGSISEVQRSGNDRSIIVKYGNENVPYAVFVHESNNAGAKYLERPLRESEHGMANRLGEDVNLER